VGVEVENEGLHFIRETSHDVATIESIPRARKEAMRAKQLGNAAYSRKDFGRAILLYEKAAGLEPGEMVYWSNLAAVMMETRAYRECVWISQKAVELGLEKGADPGLILKATKRAEKAQLILNQLEEAEKEKQEGNSRYRAGDFPAALEHYSTALQLSPGDPRILSNRAACWIKLKRWKQCLEDCDQSILLDPLLVKPHLRKATALKAMGRDQEVEVTLRRVLDLEPRCEEAIKGLIDCQNQQTPGLCEEKQIGDGAEDMLRNDGEMSLTQEEDLDDSQAESEDKLLKLAMAMSMNQ